MFSVTKLLDKLMEEMCEVGHAASKAKQYGMDLFYPGYGRNNDRLSQEVGDLLGVLDILIDHGHLDRQIIETYRGAKLKKMVQFDSNRISAADVPSKTTASYPSPSNKVNFRHPDEYKQAESKPDTPPRPYAYKPSVPVVDAGSPAFEAIWKAIKSWDIGDPARYSGYMGATGTHVQEILNALNER